jgi:hypothetical protein
VHPNLFVSVVLAVLAGSALGALAFLLLRLISGSPRKSRLLRVIPTVLVLALCLLLARFMGSFRDFLSRLQYEHDLNRLVILGLLAAALAVGFRLSIQILRARGQSAD